jgi:peptide/nickel transport system ATP-binding protein
VAEVVEAPLHPYSAGLIGSAPSRNKRGDRLAQIPGLAPPLDRRPPGCAFAPRCFNVRPDCAEPPPLVHRPGRQVLCRYPLSGTVVA